MCACEFLLTRLTSSRVNEIFMNETFKCCDNHALYGKNLTKDASSNIFQCHTQIRSKIKCKMYCTAIKEAIRPKTLNKFTFRLVICWVVFGGILFGAFLEMDIGERRNDFRCDITRNIVNIDFTQAKCYLQYQIQNYKVGIPPYLFILVNVSLIPTVTIIYAQYAKSTVNKLSKLEHSSEDAEGEPRTRRRSLFIAYLSQLVVNIDLAITSIVLLETQLFYPRNFPSHFSCYILSSYRTQSSNLFNCFNHQVGYRNVWTTVAIGANGFFAFFAFLEIVWILSRARNGKIFMENWHFYANHLKSNSDELREVISVTQHREDAQLQRDFQSAINMLKENCLLDTEQVSDLKQPFGRPNPDEGYIHNLTMDEIYVNVAIHEGRAHHCFAKNLGRWEKLKEYLPDAKDCHFAKPEDILDENTKNVLVVGRPGIGKTSLSTKILRLWASGEAFNGDHHEKSAHFSVVFLMKFRRFNGNAVLSLCELLAGAETVERLDDSVLEFVQNEPTKVLLIFDGLDEYSRKEDINAQEDDPTYKNDVEEKMPLSVLYNKLAAGKLLRGASILTTTRPKAAEYVKHVTFQRTVEILGFTSTNVEDYVHRFFQHFTGAKEKIWGQIKSNANLLSFCYIPMNCFLICHCLLQIILSECYQALPTKMTDIYEITVKMFLFNHNREGFSPQELARLKSTHMDQPFDKLPEELQNILNSLGEIAFKGIEEGRRLFESSEVSGLEDCGLLHKLPDVQSKRSLNVTPKSQFCFTHLNVQEFFAAKHLVDTKTDEVIERFVCKHIKDGTWQVVLQFVAGLLKSSTDIFIKLMPKSTATTTDERSSKPETLTSWPATREDRDLAVQVCKCLYEINDEQQPVLQNKIEKIKFNAVEFRCCSLAPIDLAAVLHFLENAEEVLYIDLSGNEFRDLGAKEVTNFIVNRERKLKWLSLDRNNLTDKAAKDLAASLTHSNCKLEYLDLSYNHFTDNAAKDLAAALEHSSCTLEYLDLSYNHFTDNAAMDLAAALERSNCKLKYLDLSYNHFTDNAAKDLAAALEHSNCELEHLDLSFNHFTDNAAKDLAAALEHSNCKLKLLDLAYNHITDNAAMVLASALRHSNCKLEVLYLSGNNFTDNAAMVLASALRHSNCKLEALYLSGNNFTDKAAMVLASALRHSNCKLEALYLSGNIFTDDAAKDFAAAFKHSNCKLKSLDLRGHNFTKRGRQYLTAAEEQSNCMFFLSKD